MKPKFWVVMTFLVLLCAGSANASNLNQNLLDGSLIPKFVDPLPVGVPDGTPGGITVLNATSVPLLGLSPTPNYNIHIREFQAQILPSGFMGPSWVWGYLTDQDQAAGGVRPSYLGPVVVAQRGVPAHPTYLNELPYPWYGACADQPARGHDARLGQPFGHRLYARQRRAPPGVHEFAVHRPMALRRPHPWRGGGAGIRRRPRCLDIADRKRGTAGHRLSGQYVHLSQRAGGGDDLVSSP